MRHTVCANLQDNDPEQAAIFQRLEQIQLANGSVSAEIVAALKAWYGGNKLAGITEYELGELHRELAWLKQNQAAAPVVTAAQPGSQPAEASQVQPGGELSEVFLNGIRKIAKPGIRLGE